MGAGGTINGRLDVNGRFFINGKKLEAPSNYGITYVQALSDFPTPVSSIINLESNQSYVVTSTIDLSGNRLVGQGTSTNLLGTSPEISKLTSTGLNPSIPLLSATNNVYLENISFINNSTVLSLDSNSPSNNAYLNTCIFRNCSSLGTIKNYELTLFDTVLGYNIGGIQFDGTMASIIFFQSIVSTYPNSTGITLLPTASLSRRFRATNMAVVNDATSTGIRVVSGAIIPTEGFILESVTFSTSSTAVEGISSNDNRANIINCTNIRNSSSVAQLFMSANAVATTIPNTTSFFKMSGNAISGPILEKFSIANNRITYTGTSERNFIIFAAASVATANGNEVIIAVGKNGVVDNFSWAAATSTGTTAFTINTQVFETLREGDFLEFFVRNSTAANNITISYMNIVLRSAN